MKGQWTTEKPTVPGWYKVYSGSEVEFAQVEYESDSTLEDRLKYPEDYPDSLGEEKELVLWLVAKEDEIYLELITEGFWWNKPERLPKKPPEL